MDYVMIPFFIHFALKFQSKGSNSQFKNTHDTIVILDFSNLCKGLIYASFLKRKKTCEGVLENVQL